MAEKGFSPLGEGLEPVLCGHIVNVGAGDLCENPATHTSATHGPLCEECANKYYRGTKWFQDPEEN